MSLSKNTRFSRVHLGRCRQCSMLRTFFRLQLLEAESRVHLGRQVEAALNVGADLAHRLRPAVQLHLKALLILLAVRQAREHHEPGHSSENRE